MTPASSSGSNNSSGSNRRHSTNIWSEYLPVTDLPLKNDVITFQVESEDVAADEDDVQDQSNQEEEAVVEEDAITTVDKSCQTDYDPMFSVDLTTRCDDGIVAWSDPESFLNKNFTINNCKPTHAEPSTNTAVVEQTEASKCRSLMKRQTSDCFMQTMSIDDLYRSRNSLSLCRVDDDDTYVDCLSLATLPNDVFDSPPHNI